MFGDSMTVWSCEETAMRKSGWNVGIGAVSVRYRRPRSAPEFVDLLICVLEYRPQEKG
jgi:hypothetical protein